MATPTVTWTPNVEGPQPIFLPVSGITNLQQTPDSSAKVMLKIFEKAQDGADPVTYLFHFNTSEARNEAKSIKDVLSRLLADLRSNDGSIPSASMAFSSAVNSQPSARWFDDSRLKTYIELQQSLMKKDKSLHQTYMEAIATKPESISGAAFNSQFWSTRTNLLRAHAIETNQKRGPYNVLSTVKPRTVDGELKLNISVEQVQMILAQHPLVKRIYNENVPKLSEADFWSRFFLSQLFKKLRGERVTESDRPDPFFDKYDMNDNTRGSQSKIMAQSVPHIIDLEANEENQGGFKGGNAKDVEMRPRANIPIVKTLNSLSEKIMANVAPSDGTVDHGQSDQWQGHGGRYDAYYEVSLRDLRDDDQEHRLMLNVKDKNNIFSKQDCSPSANTGTFAKQNTADVLSEMRSIMNEAWASNADGSSLLAAVDCDDESDSGDDRQACLRVGCGAAVKAAEKEVLSGILQQRSQKYERAPELQYLAESLKRSGARIAAVADEAETERESTIRKRKQEIRDHFERTGKKIRWKSDMVGGGRHAVLKILQPVLDALDMAQGHYATALAVEDAAGA
ncbi:hypothetical protein CDD83_2279 [Cordyceps sp. RAO-2017]|nr:hypothetical protein CDD83_2279 [Cordyceps sp. RAO-2017]